MDVPPYLVNFRLPKNSQKYENEQSTVSTESNGKLDSRAEKMLEQSVKRLEMKEVAVEKSKFVDEYNLFFVKGGVRGEVIQDRKSTFQAHAIRVSSDHEAEYFIGLLLKNTKIARATHNMSAYRFGYSGNVSEGCDDDGEAQGGSTMLKIMQQMNVVNCLVVVSRWFGGILLGTDRFKIIKDCTKEVVNENRQLFDFL